MGGFFSLALFSRSGGRMSECAHRGSCGEARERSRRGVTERVVRRSARGRGLAGKLAYRGLRWGTRAIEFVNTSLENV